MSSFVPSHTEVTAPGATPSRWMLVLHGILGSGANFRTFTRRLAAARPAWGFVLVDMRMHGRSQGAPPPHTIEAAAEDLVRLGEVLALPIAGVMGHSFGGKVALTYVARAPHELDQAWVLDTSLGVRRDRTSMTEGVLSMLRAMPQPLPSRERFLEIVAAHGQPRAIAEWLAMNVRNADDGFRFRLDLEAVQALVDAYLTTDVWPVLEFAGGARAFHVVVAGRSDAFNDDDRARITATAARTARVHVHFLADAGHWVHVDAPDALFRLVSDALA